MPGGRPNRVMLAEVSYQIRLMVCLCGGALSQLGSQKTQPSFRNYPCGLDITHARPDDLLVAMAQRPQPDQPDDDREPTAQQKHAAPLGDNWDLRESIRRCRR